MPSKAAVVRLTVVASVLVATVLGDDRVVWIPAPLAADNPSPPRTARPVPAPGAVVAYGAVGTEARRMTRGDKVRHEYSRHDPVNADGSLVLLRRIDEGSAVVYRTASVPWDDAPTPVAVVDVEEPRWHPPRPTVLTGFAELALVELDTATGRRTTVKDFARDPRPRAFLAANGDIYRVTCRDEGEPSRDLRWWCLALQGSADDYRLRALLVWDRRTDAVVGFRPLARGEADIDWVGMSPRGTCAVIGAMAENGGALVGLTMADRGLQRFHRLDFSTAHADVGLDTTGREVVVAQNVRTDHVDMIPLDWATLPILEAGGSYAGTGRVPLVRLAYDSSSPTGFRSGVHVSCNAPGRCLISTSQETSEAGRNWLDGAMVLVVLDPAAPKVARLAAVEGVAGAYWEETHGALCANGRQVLWATNWGRNVGEERVFVMQLAVPHELWP